MVTKNIKSVDVSRWRGSRFYGFICCLVAYGVAMIVALFVGQAMSGSHPLVVIALADLAATCAIFLFSVIFNNSSIYDPYWSVAPVIIAAYLLFSGLGTGTPGITWRKAIVAGLILLWSCRLTWNWARSWKGLAHEDWRYVQFRRNCGKWYWPVSFLGIHLFPTICVYLGCISLYTVFISGGSTLNMLDLIALIVTIGAILIETKADQDLLRFKVKRQSQSEILSTGVWGFVRHPNYLGEIAFWWGMFLFSLASGISAAPSFMIRLIGPLAISALFLLVSIPMIERRMLKRHPGYEHIIDTIPALIPRLPIGKRRDPRTIAE